MGLGLQFLRHVERCRVLIHLVDLSAAPEGRDPVKDFDAINRELARYSPELARRPQVVVGNKVDLPHAREALSAFEKTLAKRKKTVLPLSGATGEGLPAVLDAVAAILFAPPRAEVPPERKVSPVKRAAKRAPTKKVAKALPKKPVKTTAKKPARPPARAAVKKAKGKKAAAKR